MIVSVEVAVTYALGFVGLLAFGLIPCRAWLLAAELRAVSNSLALRRLLLTIWAALVASVLYFGIDVGTRIFKCLTGGYCGPGVASGWLYLAMLGGVYLGFEVGSYLLRLSAKRIECGGARSRL